MTRSPAKTKNAAIVTVGDELTTGLVADANTQFIARFLTSRGYPLLKAVTVGDDRRAIARAVRGAMAEADLVIVTGGLGPTHDDRTKPALMDVFGQRARHDPSALKSVLRFFRAAGKTMPAVNRSYADIPAGAEWVENRAGAAPGLFFKKRVLALPGVPHEMRHILRTKGPKLIPHGGTHFYSKTFRTSGVGEVGLSAKMDRLSEALKSADIEFLPSLGMVDVRVIARAATAEKARAAGKRASALIRPALAPHLWGEDDDTPASVAGKLLSAEGKTLAVAESCTGGGIGRKITSVPGSSAYFVGGVIGYADEVKSAMLGVGKKVLLRHGAVSPETASAMAQGALRKFKTDFAISSTGVAGPGGGTKSKPVGLVYVALAGDGWVKVRKLNLAGDRQTVRDRAANEALLLLCETLKGRR